MQCQIQDTLQCAAPTLFTDSGKTLKAHFQSQPPPHSIWCTIRTATRRAQTGWINVCCDCHISCWGVQCPDREQCLPLSDSSFKAKRQDDRWYQSLHSHRNTELDRVFEWNVYRRVIKCLFIISKKQWIRLSSWTAIVTGQDQRASETAEEWQHSTHWKYTQCVWSAGTYTQMCPHAHTQMAEEFSRGFDMQIGCWLVISAGCKTVLSFLQHNIRADNIYLKGAVDW